MDYKKYAQELVNRRGDIIAAYGYGSAFSHQSGYNENTKKSMDLIFVVDNIKKWNKQNFVLNSRDYSVYTKGVFKFVPTKFLTGGSSVIYNVITGVYDQDFKYGLIEKNRLLNDLYTWKHFYMCGRMQKPMTVIKENAEIDAAIEFNCRVALLVSLLILNKRQLTVNELLEQICSLSYSGDIRTLCIENPNKIKNIVNGNLEAFKSIYCNNKYVEMQGNVVFVNLSSVYNDFALLSKNLSLKIHNISFKMGEHIAKQLKIRNFKESIIHPTKQIFTCGVPTCMRYVGDKQKKKTLK